MIKIRRRTFFKKTAVLGGSVYLMPLQSIRSYSVTADLDAEKLFWRLVKANDLAVKDYLARGDAIYRIRSRSNAYNFVRLAAAYCCPDSEWFENDLLISGLEKTAGKIIESQRPDGTITAGNLESPPDTAFILEPICAGMYLLSMKEDQKLIIAKQKIKDFIIKAGEALVEGGIHTPNHRWVVCHALARINQLYPDEKYINRIDEWLAEGIYIDEDGHYPERSMNYSEVENNAFITMGRLLKRPDLFKAPRKNLEMTYYYMEPNGDLVTNDSRRQDQYSPGSIVNQYLLYRYLAIHDLNREFAGIARLIESFPDFEEIIIKQSLCYFMENTVLKMELPDEAVLPVSYEKLFKTSCLARIRRNFTAVTVFGGVDWPLIIASGRSVNPNFFSYRKGDAALKYMRMSAGFFGMGYFRSEGLQKQGNKYLLYKKLEVPYYQPLPKQWQNPDGNYELTPSLNERYWSKMAFDKRPVSNVKILESRISVQEDNGKVDMLIEVYGTEEVTVTVELCFDQAGSLEGVTDAADGQDNHFLAGGFGVFEKGRDKITFGPGIKKHDRIYRLEGEKYSVHSGTLRTEGKHVYLTGITPFRHALTFD